MSVSSPSHVTVTDPIILHCRPFSTLSQDSPRGVWGTGVHPCAGPAHNKNRCPSRRKNHSHHSRPYRHNCAGYTTPHPVPAAQHITSTHPTSPQNTLLHDNHTVGCDSPSHTTQLFVPSAGQPLPPPAHPTNLHPAWVMSCAWLQVQGWVSLSWPVEEQHNRA